MREIHGKHTTFADEKIFKQYQNNQRLIFVKALMFGDFKKCV